MKSSKKKYLFLSHDDQKEIKIFEAFAGIGTQRKALENIAKSKNWKITSVGIVEWYIDAIIGYVNLHHPEIKLPKKKLEADISDLSLSTDSKKLASKSILKRLSKTEKAFYIKKSQEVCNNLFNINEIQYHQIPKEIDIFTYSFPCQDLSLQGKQIGMSQDSGSRSSLLWQIKRIFKDMKENWNQEDMPKYLLLENVKNIVSVKHKPDLNIWIQTLKDFGYKSYIYILNASSFGSPQNRERAFVLSIRNDFEKTINFKKPIFETVNQKTSINIFPEINDKKPLEKLNKYKHSDFLLTKNNINKASLLNYSTFHSEAHIYDPNFSGPTLTASGANSRIKIIDENNHIYSLTSSYLYRYMGMSASDYKKVSKSGLITENKLIYLAGNAISINVLEAIFKKLEF